MQDLITSLVAYVVTAVMVCVFTWKSPKVGKQWRRPWGPLLRLAVVFVLLHYLFDYFGLDAWKGYVGGAVFALYLFLTMNLGGMLGLFPVVVAGAVYQWVFWFPIREELVHRAEPKPMPIGEGDALVGVSGVVVNDLRPVGVIEIQGDKREARSSMDLIRKGERVVVERVNGRELVVRRCGGGEV